MNPARLRAYLYLIAVVVIWGVSGPVIKLLLGVVPWDILLVYRFLISAIIYLPFIKPEVLRPLKKVNVLLLVLAYTFLNTTISLGLLFAGTAKTSLVSMSLLSLFGPILTILAGYFFLRDRITRTEKLGIIITFLGSMLIIIEPVLKFDGIQGELVGNLFIIGSLITGSLAIIILKKLLRKGVDPMFLGNMNFVIGAITLIPVVLRTRSVPEVVNTITNLGFPYQIGVWYLAIFAGSIAYYLSNSAQKSIEVSEQAVFSYIYPIFSAILAVWILKETMTPLSYFGAGIIIAEVKRRTRK
jgi:drug/metabolite transporter (DMT)-like permease